MEFKIFISLLLLLLTFFIFRGRKGSKRVPPGSLGLPIIGQSFGLLKALKADKVEEWFQKRITKYGPIWKVSLFGHPTVVLHGPSANKFVYTYDGNVLVNMQPSSVSRILGVRNITELSGNDHKRVRAALVSFLKPEVLKQYVVKIDDEIKNHLEMHWHGKHEVKVQPLMKTLTFNIICALLFGIERGPKREQLLPLFTDMISGALAIPINLPFTQFSNGLQARAKLQLILVDLLRDKRALLKQQEQGASCHKDLVTSLLSLRDENNLMVLSDEEIIDNIVVVMVAGFDTTSGLLTFLVRLLATNESVSSSIIHEQEEIAKSKGYGEALTWDDLNKMKYTWRVASEILRMNPPIALTFRRALQDIDYGGYLIPKGWQVLLAACMTHMDNTIFRDPRTFDPARFEQQTPPPPPFSFITFGGGPRMCPGFELAKMECLAMVHHLVTRFTWKLLLEDDSFERTPLAEFNQGLPIQISPK